MAPEAQLHPDSEIRPGADPGTDPGADLGPDAGPDANAGAERHAGCAGQDADPTSP